MLSYPDHLTDELRIKIAGLYWIHAQREILGRISDGNHWLAIDLAIFRQTEWLINNGLIRDFWNLIHGISMGWDLKSLVGYLTSANIQWLYRPCLSLREVKFNPIGESGRLAVDQGCVTVQEVSDWYNQPKNRRLRIKHLVAFEMIIGESPPREDFPLILLDRTGIGSYCALNGNGRINGTVLKHKSSLDAFIGQVINPQIPLLTDHWVPTSTMMELVDLHREKPDAIEAIAQTLATMVADSSVGRIELKNRAIDLNNLFDRQLLYKLCRSLPEHRKFFLEGLE